MLRSPLLCLLALLAASEALAQPGGQAPAPGARPIVLLTGYWPPTNEMLRRFSHKIALNPQGWIGADWMGRGYDVVAFFPEFNNPNCTNCGTGTGDLKVDYQDTAADFERITEGLAPIAIVTFSRANSMRSWELERNQYNRQSWFNDFVPPFRPTPSPPDATVPTGAVRLSTLPAQRIVDAVAAAQLPLDAFVCESLGGGGFLSEYIAYLGAWYQARHDDPSQSDWCIAAGHVHVGGNVSWADGLAATEITVATLLDHLDEIRNCTPVRAYCDAGVNASGGGAQLSALGAPSIAANNVRLFVQRVPNNTSGLTFYGPTQTLAPLGDGWLCVGGVLTRLPVTVANSIGVMQIPLDFLTAPLGVGTTAVSAGSTLNFQTWYRDSGFGTGFNTTNAIEITFCP